MWQNKENTVKLQNFIISWGLSNTSNLIDAHTLRMSKVHVIFFFSHDLTSGELDRLGLMKIQLWVHSGVSDKLGFSWAQFLTNSQSNNSKLI